MRTIPRRSWGSDAQFRAREPFPHVVVDGFLEADRALEVARAFPTFDEARAAGLGFETEYEHLKVQLTDPREFPEPIRRVHEDLASAEFLSELARLTGIRDLIADPRLQGGGIHMTDSGGRLDVHVDFNYLPDEGWWRRLNLLLYLNEEWRDEWGGHVELWDADVQNCRVSVAPVLNRCLIFETSAISYHGVTKVTSPPGVPRKSVSAYYYTRHAPPDWDDDFHGTVFRRRPGERS